MKDIASNDLATNKVPPNDYIARRGVIDKVATLRARTLRVALIGHMLQSVETEADRAAHISDLRKQSAALERLRPLLQGVYTKEDIDPETCMWVAAIAKSQPDLVRVMLEVLAQAETLCASLQSQSENSGQLLKRFVAHIDEAFFETVTRFCDSLWSNQDTAFNAETARATQSKEIVSKTLSRLEHIGKHVRLVSLNASVEAARAGESGRGLSIIAVEFKSLAEEIRSLATHARQEIGS